MADWQQIKTEYITTDTSYRKLAQKYGVSYQAICHRSKTEGWIALREQHMNKTISKTVEKISEKKANMAAKVHTVADKLLYKIDASVDLMVPGVMNTKSLRALTAAVKDLKDILMIRSELDEREQEARIDKLRREAQKEDMGKDSTLEVVFEGGDVEDWSE